MSLLPNFISTFSLKLCHQDTFYLNSLWNSGMWNVNWWQTSKMIICMYFRKQNQLPILSSLQMPPQKQSQTDRRKMSARRGRNKWDIPAHWKLPAYILPTPSTAHSCILKPTLSHQIIQAWNANLTISNILNNPPLGLTVQSDITSNCHLHSFKISSHILTTVAHFRGYECVLPGSEAVKMRGSKMNFWNLSIGAFSPGP